MKTPKTPPTRWPGKSPTGSEYQRTLASAFSAPKKMGPPRSPRMIALAGVYEPREGGDDDETHQDPVRPPEHPGSVPSTR